MPRVTSRGRREFQRYVAFGGDPETEREKERARGPQGGTNEICGRREKNKALSWRTTVESSVTCLRRRIERPRGRTWSAPVEEGSETVKSIQCFVLSDAKRV